jgi:hypothetical protein
LLRCLVTPGYPFSSEAEHLGIVLGQWNIWEADIVVIQHCEFITHL